MYIRIIPKVFMFYFNSDLVDLITVLILVVYSSRVVLVGVY